MTTIKELKEAIVEAVATLDESDGSRVSTSEAIDTVREILGNAYGPELDDAVEDFLGTETDDEDADADQDDA